MNINKGWLAERGFAARSQYRYVFPRISRWITISARDTEPRKPGGVSLTVKRLLVTRASFEFDTSVEQAPRVRLEILHGAFNPPSTITNDSRRINKSIDYVIERGSDTETERMRRRSIYHFWRGTMESIRINKREKGAKVSYLWPRRVIWFSDLLGSLINILGGISMERE